MYRRNSKNKTQQTMTKGDILDRFPSMLGIRRADALKYMSILFECMAESLVQGDSVRVMNFGVFWCEKLTKNNHYKKELRKPGYVGQTVRFRPSPHLLKTLRQPKGLPTTPL